MINRTKQMIPQVSKYNFYLYSDFSDGDNPLNLIQLIAHSDTFIEDNSLTENQRTLFELRKEFCEIVFEDDWSSRNGKIQFFFEFRNGEHAKDYYIKLISLADQLGFTSEIENIQNSLDFYLTHETKIKYLSEEEGDNWWEEVQALEKKYTFNYSMTDELAKSFKKTPSDYCRDENGHCIDPDYSGRVKYYLKNGILFHDYSVVNGQVLGECFDYDLQGNITEISIRDGYRKKESIKRWYPNGQIEYEKLNESDFRYWYKNGQIRSEKVDGVIKRYDENGFEMS